MPLLNTDLFSVVFMRVAPDRHAGPLPGVRLLRPAGVELHRVGAALRGDLADRRTANLVTKVYFPREIFPLLGRGRVARRLCSSPRRCSSRMMVYYRIDAVGRAAAACRSCIVVQIAFTAALALLLAMANLFYRDVKYLFEVVLTVWMFASAVVYPADAVGGALGALIRANPMTAIVEAYRHVLLYGIAARAGVVRVGRRAQLSPASVAWLAVPPLRNSGSRRTSDE